MVPSVDGRNLPVDVWYPADFAYDAPPVSSKGPFPLVVYSYGSGGLRYIATYFTERLAAAGFVGVAPRGSRAQRYGLRMADASTDRSSDRETVERVIPVPPEKIFALVADPSRHKDIDGSGTVRDSKDAPSRLSLGAKFGMNMKMGLPYSMESTVIEYDDNRCVAWQSRPRGFGGKISGGRIWRYDLEPVDGGTRVRETWDISEEKQGTKALVKLGRKKTRENMTKTLERIEELTTTTP